jgi:hypothetical protein
LQGHKELEIACNDYATVFYIAKYNSPVNKKIIFSDDDVKWIYETSKQWQRLQDFLERKYNERDL